MKNFFIRTISGFVYVLLVLGSIVAGPVYFGILIFIFLVLSLYELYRMSDSDRYQINRGVFFIPAIIIYLLIFYWSVSQIVFVTPGLFGLFHLLLIYQLFSAHKKPVFNPPVFGVLPIIYLAIPLALLNYYFYFPLNQAGPGREVVAGFFIIIWLNDTFAYLTGKLLGSNKMFESVSPNKTWEGSAGGFVSGMAGAYLISVFSSQMSTAEWLGLAAITIITGTFGDLFESLLKRRSNLKDSGRIIPGHGGILDRLDSILLASPFVFLYLYFVVG